MMQTPCVWIRCSSWPQAERRWRRRRPWRARSNHATFTVWRATWSSSSSPVTHKRLPQSPWRQPCRDGYTAIGGIQMPLVAVPTDLVALGIARGSVITGRGEVLEHLRQERLAWVGHGRLLGRRTDIPLRGRPRFFAGACVSETLATIARSAAGIAGRTGGARASMAVPSRRRCPIRSWPRGSLISAAGRDPSSGVRSAPASWLSPVQTSPQKRWPAKRVRAADAPLRSPTKVRILRCAPSRVSMTFSRFGVSEPTSLRNSGNRSC